VSTSVLHFKQTPLVGSELAGFGKTPLLDSCYKLGHLFASHGQLQIIETPFEVGEHVCTSPIQATSLIQDLRSLHHQGLSHGDIRAYNCVFSDEGSHLIDFDFGGLAGTVPYPEGYRAHLDDGTRIPETVLSEDCAIQKWHDVYALVKLLLESHEVIPYSDAGYKEKDNLNNLNHQLITAGSDGERDERAAEILDRLERFLEGKVSINPHPELKLAVKWKSTESSGKKTLDGFGGTPEHRKKK
jgi:hypothetical protein